MEVIKYRTSPDSEWKSLETLVGEGVPAGGSAGQVLAKKSAADYDTEWVNQTGGSGGGSVAIDNKTIIENEDGTIGTAIGGCWVDGEVKSDYLVEITGTGNVFSNKDVSSTFTYELAKFLYDCSSVTADCKTGHGEMTNMVVTKTLTTTDDTEVYNFQHGVYNGDTKSFTYTGTYTISTGTWVMLCNMTNAGVYYDKFYAMVPGKVPSPISTASFIPLSEDFTVDSDKLKLNWLKLSPNGGFCFNYNNQNPNGNNAGKSSLAGGRNSSVGAESISWGSNITGGGTANAIFGDQVHHEKGNYSFGANQTNYIRNHYQFSAGNYNNWYGSTFGQGTAVFGQGNTPASPWSFNTGKWSAFDTDKIYAHIVGNGTDNSNRANAYTLDWSGNATFAGTVSSAGADYAEFFEWLDGNSANEDRVGYIVALDGDKIRLANADDDVLGIISGTATVLGDNAEWCWNKRYLTDDFGRTIYEDREVVHEAAYNDEGELVQEEWTEVVHAPVVNPDYDPDKPYINRRNRPEWAAVGMMGKLFVRDDGSCLPNFYATVGENGVATLTATKTNMRVMKRVTDNIVQVCLK